MLPPFLKKGGKYSAFLVQQVERETRMRNHASIISHSAGKGKKIYWCEKLGHKYTQVVQLKTIITTLHMVD